MRHFHKDRGIRFAPALWQAKNYYALMILMAYGVPALIGTLLGDWLGGLLVIGSARLMFQYHLTWIVNSYGHIRGEKIENGLSATATNNNGLLAILTVGELLHANHHERPRSYRFGTRSRDMDIGWWVIEACMLVGLARPLEKRSH
jgi:stearoyl-CoA desaturase (delta-9 desaturase)